MDAIKVNGNTEYCLYSSTQDKVLQDPAKGQLFKMNTLPTNCVSNTNRTNTDTQVLSSQQVANIPVGNISKTT